MVDPGIQVPARFTNPDVFVAAATATCSPGAYPVAYYEDGHCAFGKERSRKVVVDRRNRRDMLTEVTVDSEGVNRHVIP